jgi:FkbM family methyltransferase
MVAMPPAAEPMTLAAPEPPHRRSRARGLLGRVRPAVLPFLDRLDSRIRWAVDRSTVAARLADVETRAMAANDQATAVREAADVRLAARLDQLGAASARIEQTLAVVAGTLDTVTHRLDAMETGLGAVRMGASAGAASARRIEAAVMEAAKRDHAAVERDRAAVERDRAADQRLAGLAQAAERQERRLDGLEEAGGRWVEQRLAERLDALDSKTAQRLGPLLELVTAVARRLVLNLGRDLVIKTPSGYVLAPAEDAAVVVALVDGPGMLESGTTAVVQALLPEGGTMVDVGGHIGLLALPGARRVGAAGRVIVLEPTPRMAQLIRRTMALNDIGWVQVHECAGGDSDGLAGFSLSSQTTNSSLFPVDNAVEQIEVRMCRLDTLVPAKTRVDLVKIDVEGAELLVWRGMQRLLADNPAAPVILEFGPSHLQRVGTTITDWFAEITAAGHTPWEIDAMTGQLRPLRAVGLEAVFSVNILLLRGNPAERGLVVA